MSALSLTTATPDDIRCMPGTNMDTLTLSTDEQLAQAASSSLWIGSQEVVRCDTTSYVLPKKSQHGGLYNYSVSCAYSATIKDNESLSSTAHENGVPGFPEFPAFWTGEEGGARVRKKVREQARKGRAKRNERKSIRIIRSSVNSPYGNRCQKRGNRVQKQKKRMEKLQKMELKQKRQKDMRDISKNLSLLKCV